MDKAEKIFIAETKAALGSNSRRIVLAKIRELKETGRVSILPLLLDLLEGDPHEEIVSAVMNLLSDLRDQQCVPVIVEYINKYKQSPILSSLIASCWQSPLDYSNYLETFSDCFITGNYQDAIESFTVIEEMIVHCSENKIEKCRMYLLSRQTEVKEEKKPLFRELLKLLLVNN